jgi:hypothetical protein
MMPISVSRNSTLGEELNRRSATFFVHPTITKSGKTQLQWVEVVR